MGNGNGTDSKPGPSDGNDVAMRSRRRSIVDWVLRLAKTFDVELEPERVEDYIIALAPMAEAARHVMFRKAIESWSKVNAMPPIAFLLDLAAKYHSTVEQELTSAAKWGDVEAKRILGELRAKAPPPVAPHPETDEDRRQFVEREILAMRERYRTPGDPPKLEDSGPTDPAKRRAWAHAKAVEMGWITEGDEPGTEATNES
jgi:hypothetical protein